MPSITLRGVPHHYCLTPASSGSETLVFLHGWLLSRQYWSPVIEQISSTYRCLSYDLRGFGESCRELEHHQAGMLPVAQRLGASYSPFSLAAYARDLGDLLEQLGLGPVWLVGHSLGASIALWAAYCYPERVKGVVCVNAGGGIYLRQAFERFRAAGQQIVRLRPGWVKHVPWVDLAFTRMMVAQPLARQWGRQRLLDLLQAHPEAALGALLESTTETEVHLLPRIVSALTQPVYFIAGAQDAVMELKYVFYLASFHRLFTVDCGNVVELPNCGHMAMVERPDQVAKALLTLLPPD
jgi:2-succinyl-6-hydroxy-2,4-cyclohexadiene-1-carboxylate synthase